jgi:protein subunit release factor B
MTYFPVSESASKDLEKRMQKLGLREQDLQEQFVRSGGPGGQNVNKVSSCVILTHLPTGTTVRCQQERSQAMNRFLARRRLVEKMEEQVLGAASQKQRDIEKIRRQKRKRSRRAKQKMLESKHHRSQIKQTRRPPTDD